MSRQRIVDADAHFFDPVGEFYKYIDDPWKTRLKGRSDSGQLLPGSTGDRFMAGRIKREETNYPDSDSDPEEIPKIMDIVGVDDIILLTNRMLTFGGLSSAEKSVALAQGYIRYMLDKVVDPDQGIYTMLIVPYHDPEESVELIDEVKDEAGVVGLCMVTAGPEPPLGHHRYDPIYEAAEQAGLPVVFHSGGSSLDEFYIRGYEKFIETHTLGFLWNNMAQLTSILIQGVPEKFPNLEICFQESGIFWVPMMMHRLDTGYLKRPSEAPLLNQRPSKYMKEFYYGTQPLEQPEDMADLENTINAIGGPEQLMYASDYPHWDYDLPSVIHEIPFLSKQEKDGILGGNATKVFGL